MSFFEVIIRGDFGGRSSSNMTEMKIFFQSVCSDFEGLLKRDGAQRHEVKCCCSF